MEYRIEGKTLPVVICRLNAGETMVTERGSISWMSPNMKMETIAGGGLGRALGRMFAGGPVPKPPYRPGRPGHDRLCLQLPGDIRAFEIGPGRELVVQKSGCPAAAWPEPSAPLFPPGNSKQALCGRP